MTNVALVGCAHIHTPFFVKTLKENTNIKVACVWDHDEERGAARAAELETLFVSDVEKIWSDSSIEAVIIASETNLHEKLVIAAAESSKHIFAEKPLGFSAQDAKKVACIVQEKGVLFQTGYFMRSLKVHLYLKKLLDEGAFGTVTRVRHSNCHCGSLSGWFDSQWRWMADPAISGCGAFGDLGTHSLDILMWLFGRPEKVTASIRTVTGRYGENCDESGEGLLCFPNGITATLAGGWVDMGNPVMCEISGTKLHASVVNGQLYLKGKELPGADGVTPWADLPEALPHAFVLFLDAVCGKELPLPLVTVQEAADRSVVMEALYKAAANSSWEVPEY